MSTRISISSADDDEPASPPATTTPNQKQHQQQQQGSAASRRHKNRRGFCQVSAQARFGKTWRRRAAKNIQEIPLINYACREELQQTQISFSGSTGHESGSSVPQGTTQEAFNRRLSKHNIPTCSGTLLPPQHKGQFVSSIIPEIQNRSQRSFPKVLQIPLNMLSSRTKRSVAENLVHTSHVSGKNDACQIP